MPVRVNPGELKTWVTIDDPVVDGTPVTYTPNRIKVGFRRTLQSGENVVVWDVIARYHPQVSFNTRMTLDDGRQVFVRGIDNVGNLDRSGFTALTCEEVLTP